MAEEQLILDLVSRLGAELPIVKPDGGKTKLSYEQSEELAKKHEDALVKLSYRSRVNMVASGLRDLFDRVAKYAASPPQQVSSEEAALRVARSHLYLVELLKRCLEYSWDYVKAQIQGPGAPASNMEPVSRERAGAAGDESEAMRMKEWQEAVLPPPLEEHLAKYLADIVCQLVLKPHQALQNELRKKAAAALFQLSACNYEVVFSRIVSQMGADEENSPLPLVECLNVNQQRLSELIEQMGQVLANLKKGTQFLVAKVVRRAIWNWIDHYPLEFVRLCQARQRLPGGPDQLFDQFDALVAKTKARNEYWPVQTMLLLLCPDILYSLQVEKDRREHANKDKFIEALKQGLKTPKLADLATRCCVDLCRASTYFSKQGEGAALRMWIATNIETDLKDRLLNPAAPLKLADGAMVDVRTLTEFLVASYRLNTRKTTAGFFPICLSRDAPPQFRLAMVKCLVTIAREANVLDWPSFVNYYPELSSMLRGLFLEFASAAARPEVHNLLLNPQDTRKTKAQLEKVAIDLEVLTKLIGLFQADPELALFPSRTAAQDIEESRSILTGLAQAATLSFIPFLAEAATRTLIELHRPALIERWCRQDALRGFWEVSSAVLVQLATTLAARPDPLLPPAQRVAQLTKLVQLLEELLRRRIAFLARYQECQAALRGAAPGSLLQPLAASGSEARAAANTRLEIALLILLCSSETEIASRAASCLGLLCDELDLLAADASGSADGGAASSAAASAASSLLAGNTILANYNTFRRVAATAVRVTGRVAQQKAVRSALRRIEHATPGNQAAWEEVYARWREATSQLRQAEAEAAAAAQEAARRNPNQPRRAAPAPAPAPAPATSDLHLEWQHYTGFLLALAGVCIRAQNPQPASASSSSSSSKSRPATAGSSSSGGGGGSSVESFLLECMDLVRDEYVNVREPVKMLAGQATAPAAYPVLFRQMHDVLRSYFGAAGQVLTRSVATLFVEQAIQIIKLILEQPLENADELSLLTDFEPTMLDLLRYVSQLLPSVATLVIKKKMCELLDLMMEKRAALPFRNEIKFRNALVEQTIEWISDFAAAQGGPSAGSGASSSSSALSATMRGGPLVSGAEGAGAGAAAAAAAADLAKLQKDLDQSCMKAVSSLLRGLPVVGGTAEQAAAQAAGSKAGAPAATEVAESKTNRFIKYFNFFTALLTRAKKDAHEAGALPELTIAALSSLLSANIDCGLEHFVTMGYHEDLETRAAFLRVLANILNQGAEFEQAAEDAADRYDRLLEFLFEPEMHLVLALCDACPITEADEVAAILVRIFEANERAVSLLRALIAQEVQRTESPNTLFRRNSVATKAQSAYARLVGQQYLKDCFARLLNELLTRPEEQLSFELDPQKAQPTDDLVANQANVAQVSQMYLDAIRDHLPRCPAPFREICHFLHECVQRRFPEVASLAVGGFIFLRFLCPAIVAPDSFGVVPSLPSPGLRRGLVLVTKVLQNLANMVLITKEPYMQPLNPFIEQNMPLIRHLYERFAEVPPDAPPPPPVHITDDQKEEDLRRLHHYLVLYQEKILRTLSQEKAAKEKGLAERFSILLAQLGPPPEPTSGAARSITTARPLAVGVKGAGGAAALLEQFLKRMADRSTEAIRETGIYYQAGQSREKHPVFYLIARQYTQEMDTDLLLLHILRTTQAAWSKPFMLVVDLVHFSSANRLAPTSCSYILQHIPDVAYANLERVVFLAPNHAFKKYVKGRVTRLIVRGHKKFVFLPTPSRLAEFIDPREQQLPAATLAVDTEVKATFDRVLKLGNQVGHSPKEVVLRVSNTSLQVISCRLHNVLNKPTPLVDLYQIASVEEIHSPSESELVLKIDLGGPKFLAFKASNVEQIIQNIKASIYRLNLTRKDQQQLRQFRPSDVPGTLLNMSLLNLGAQRNALRTAAYSLLTALCHNFKFALRLELLDTPDLSIPKNSRPFVLRVSRKLAHTEPQLTLEFLREALLSFGKTNPTGKLLCLEYIEPWLPNLSALALAPPGGSPEQAERLARVREILHSLIDMSQREGPILPAVLRRVWETLGREKPLLDLVIDCLMQKALLPEGTQGMPPAQPNPVATSVLAAAADPASAAQGLTASLDAFPIGDIFITLAAQNTQLVSGRLIFRALRLLAAILSGPKPALSPGSSSSAATTTTTPSSSSASSASSASSSASSASSASSSSSSSSSGSSSETWFDEHESWGELCVVLRVLFLLSFENLVDVSHYLPELLHLVLQVYGTGSTLMRATVHGLLVNIVHSLYTSMATDEERLQSLRFQLNELSALRFRLHFGIGGQTVTAFSKPNLKERRQERMAIATVEPVASAMLQVLQACSPSTLSTATGTPWHSRLLSLMVSTAFQYLSPRAFVSLGVLCTRDASGRSLISDELLAEMLLRLRDSLLASVHNVGHDLPVSILLCLARLYEFVSPRSRFYAPMFWLAMVAAQLSDPRLFPAACALLESVLRVLDASEALKARDHDLQALLMAWREGPLDTMLSRLETHTNISFKTSFSFAVAAHLLKGLKSPQTKTVTSRLLASFLELGSRRGFGPQVLGYMAALLPLRGDPLVHSREQVHTTSAAAAAAAAASASGAASAAAGASSGSVSGEKSAGTAGAGAAAGGTQAGAGAAAPQEGLSPTLQGPQAFFIEGMLPDTQTAALLFTFLVTLLQHSDVEHEQQFIYEALREGVQRMPEAFLVTYDKLIPRMSQILRSCQTRTLVDPVLAIMQSMFAYLSQIAQPSSQTQRLGSQYLQQIGFAGMSHYDTFNSLVLASHRERMIEVVAGIIDYLVELR